MSATRHFRLPRGKTLFSGIVLAASMLVAYTSVGVWLQQHRAKTRTQAAITSEGENPFASANGINLIAFVVTASDCGWSTRPEVKAAVRSLRAKMRSVHGGAYATVSVIAVDIDRDVTTGLRFLDELGSGHASAAFDQVIVGGGWINDKIVESIWRGNLAVPASPQVLVIERPLNTDSYLLTSEIGVGKDTVVANPVGSEQVFKWVTDGMSLVHASAHVQR